MEGSIDELYSFMTEYQESHGEPPLMREMVEAIAPLTYRSSVRYLLVRLVDEGKVREVADPGFSRRYSAV